MATRLVCDLCARTIASNTTPTTVKVQAFEEGYDDEAREYELHNNCWKRIKGMFKVK